MYHSIINNNNNRLNYKNNQENKGKKSNYKK